MYTHIYIYIYICNTYVERERERESYFSHFAATISNYMLLIDLFAARRCSDSTFRWKALKLLM